jgi:hypothetical protein
MWDTSSDKSGLLTSSHSQDIFVDFFPPPPYTAVVIPQRRQHRDSEAGPTTSTAVSCQERRLRIRLLLLVLVAVLSLLAIVGISLQLIVRHLAVGQQQQQQLAAPQQQQQQLGLSSVEDIIEIQLLKEEESQKQQLVGEQS